MLDSRVWGFSFWLSVLSLFKGLGFRGLDCALWVPVMA